MLQSWYVFYLLSQVFKTFFWMCVYCLIIIPNICDNSYSRWIMMNHKLVNKSYRFLQIPCHFLPCLCCRMWTGWKWNRVSGRKMVPFKYGVVPEPEDLHGSQRENEEMDHSEKNTKDVGHSEVGLRMCHVFWPIGWHSGWDTVWFDVSELLLW